MGHGGKEVADILETQVAEKEKILAEQEQLEKSRGRPRHWEHLKYSQLPPWMQDNEFILAHHRPVLRSFNECFRSIWGLHSETGNIWSHLLGCLAFLGFALRFFDLPKAAFLGHELSQKIVFFIFFLGVILCLSLSATFHTLTCHSKQVNWLFHKLDYVGISLLIVGSYIPWTYYGLYCHETAKAMYLAAIVTLCILTIILTMAERFATPSFRPLRAGLFVALGCFGIFPYLHFASLEGWSAVSTQLRPDIMLPMGGMYIFGALLYGARFPECLFPGRFDLLGQSHQIFHILVVLAALLHLKGTYDMADFRFSPEGACQPLVEAYQNQTL